MKGGGGDALSWLLLNALLPGATSGAESGRRFQAKPESGETWLVLSTDTTAFRERIFHSRTEPVCDYVVIYFRRDSRPTVAAIELKGADASRACKQLDNTIRGLRATLDSSWSSSEIGWRAIIVGKGSAPRNLSVEQRRFRIEHGAVLESISANQADIGPILRRRD